MSVAATYAPNRYHRVQMNTVSLNNAHTKALVGASLKGYSLHCIIFRTATDPACWEAVLSSYNCRALLHERSVPVQQRGK